MVTLLPIVLCLAGCSETQSQDQSSVKSRAEMASAYASVNGGLKKAVNLNGPQLTVNGVVFEAESSSGISVAGASRHQFSPQMNFSPTTDTSTNQMLNSMVYNRSGDMTVSIPVANGSYTVYLYIPSDSAGMSFQLSFEGIDMGGTQTTGTAGSWKKLGPYNVNVADGALTLRVTGYFNLAGLEVYDALSGSTPTPIVSGPPQEVKNLGYTTRTFLSNNFSSANVDLKNTGNPSFQWFLRDPTVWQGVSPADILKFHEDGSLSVAGRISTVYSGYSVEPWHGSAYGGGAYFEATLSFSPDAVLSDPGGGFPAWWGQPIEHWALSGSGADWWKGKGDWFVHYVETDFMEYAFVGGSKNHYWGATIDWSGVWNNQTGYPTMIQNYNTAKIEVPQGNDFNKPHRFGYLWVPATATTKGYFQYFFDGKPASSRVEYSKYDCTNPPQTIAQDSPWLFGVLDCQHQALIMNASPRAPLRVYSVEVWQGAGRKVLAQ